MLVQKRKRKKKERKGRALRTFPCMVLYIRKGKSAENTEESTPSMEVMHV